MAAQAFQTAKGKRLLVINKRNRPQQITLPADADGATVNLVAPSTGTSAPATHPLSGRSLSLEPFEVAVVAYR